MDNRGALIVIINCLLVHLAFALDIPCYILNTRRMDSIVVAMNGGFGVSLLLLPLFGLIADIYVTRYRMIQTSLLSLAAILILGLTTVYLSIPYSGKFSGV